MGCNKAKIPYADALLRAQAIEQVVAPVCERTLIAGSIRRRKPEIGDVELVVIPKTAPVFDMFGEPSGMRDLLDEYLSIYWRGHITKNGPKYKQLVIDGLQVDLFIASRETWACIATIRTGSADFTHWLVTPRRSGGGCPSHLKFSDGRLMCGETPIDLPDERDLFDALGWPWIDPIDRTAGRWPDKAWR